MMSYLLFNPLYFETHVSVTACVLTWLYDVISCILYINTCAIALNTNQGNTV